MESSSELWGRGEEVQQPNLVKRDFQPMSAANLNALMQQ